MARKLLLTPIFILSGFFTNAQQPPELWDEEKKKKTDANIIGDVQCNGEHVPFINIIVEGTTIGTMTDATGHYQLVNLPVGELQLRVSGMGYKSQVKKVTTRANKTIEVNFRVEEDVLHLNDVVVTADRNQTNRSEAPVIVNSVSTQLMTATQSVTIAEGLQFTPGLRTETNCQNCGFTQLRMNGMEGPYTQILMNSRPVFSGLAGVYGLKLIPSNMVERIEVVRGGGSALFGGNAIAGTVNIITKEPRRNTFNWEGRTAIIGTGVEEADQNALDGQMNFNASIITDDHKSGGYIYTMLRNRDEWDANNDGFSEMVKLKNTTFGFNVFHKPSAKSKISLDGYRIQEFRRGGNMLDYLPHEADIAEQLEHLISGANLSFDLFTNGKYDKLTLYVSAQHVDRDSYYGAEQDPNAYGDTKNLTHSAGGYYTLNSNHLLFGRSTTLLGVDNTNDYLKDTKLGANGKSNTLLTRQSVNTLGAFLQQNWKLKKVNLGIGMRYDYSWVNDLESDSGDIDNGVWIPRVNILYKLTPDFRFRIGYARGYRAPQVFNEDLHIELVNANRVETFNSDDLKQETSDSFTASINSVFTIDNSYHDLLLEGFYTRLNDPFANTFYPLDDQGNFAYMRINAEDGAYVSGVNMEWKSFLSNKWESQVGFTIQTSRYESPQQWGDEENSISKKFLRTPDKYGYATLIWRPSHHFNASFTLNYTGSMLVPHFGLNPDDFDDPDEAQKVIDAISRGDIILGEKLEESSDFMVADLLVSYDFHLTDETELQFYLGIKNIFNQLQDDYDRGIYRDAGYIYGPSQPRTINFGIKFGNVF